MLNKTRNMIAAFVLLLMVVVIGCSNNTQEGSQNTPETNPSASTADQITPDNNQSAKSDEPAQASVPNVQDNTPITTDPVTLKFYMHVAFPIETYNKLIVDPLKKKFPNVTLELIEKESPGANPGLDLERILASGMVPDLVYTSSLHLSYFKDGQLTGDLTDLAKKFNLDLSIYNSPAINAIKTYSDGGELYALPMTMNYGALHYNMDIFDNFGIPYPTDGMTWQDVIDLARQVAREKDGVTYSGIAPGFFTGQIAGPLSLPYFDEAGKANFTTDGWVQAMNVVKDISTIPGNEDSFKDMAKRFMTDKNTAMIVYPLMFSQLEVAHEAGDVFNWGVVQYPQFPNAPGKSSQVDAHTILVANTSKHKELAFQIAAFLTSNEEVQTMATKDGRMTALTDPEFQKIFGANLAVLQGKDIQGIFKSVPAEFVQPNKYNGIASSALNSAATTLSHANNTDDINTLLRKAEEKINQQVAADQGK